MDVAAYLRSQREHLGRQSQNVRDFSVFDFDYVPPQPLMRDEARQLIDDLLRFDLTGIPTHYVVIGSRGCGKTLTVKFLQRVLPPQTGLVLLYANCRAHNTSFKVLAHLLNREARGAAMTELFENFCAQQRSKTVVVLDEIDLMSPKDPRREILYLLSRAAQPFMVIALANNPHVLKQLDPATRSSLQPVPLHFRNYDAQQILAILRDRAQRGLHTWDAGQLSEIAALTTRQTNADARIAIKTLFYTTTRSDESLTACFERARRDVVVDLIHDLSDATLVILWAVATSRSDFAKAVYRRYDHCCRTRTEKAFSYVHFYANLSYLQSVGLVALASTKTGRTYTNRVLLNTEAEIVEQIFRLRFGT